MHFFIIKIKDIRNALHSLNVSKSPRLDDIPPAIFIVYAPELATTLHRYSFIFVEGDTQFQEGQMECLQLKFH